MSLQWAAAGAFVFFLALGVAGKPAFHLDGPAWYFFLGLMAALGLGSSALILYWQSRRNASVDGASAAGSGAPSAAGVSEVDHWIREANARLAQSKRGAGIANLPMIFVAGDRGTAKTSTILHSGMEPELLAGQVYQGQNDSSVVPTRGANLFFARDTVFVEAGGVLLSQPGNWKSLVARLRPARIKSLMGGGGQAPRGVLLCFDIEAFTRAGAADAIGNAARYLRDRLGEISQVLGISFPVYVLFTRMDRVACFSEFVRNLTPEEAGQVVGATLPIPQAATGGVYAEEETNRLAAAFDGLVFSFCDQRPRLLPREMDAEKVPAAYEFPREFRKLRNLLVQFLVDVGRPSQLRTSPFLRGFYFSGVRPIEVRDQPPPVVQPAKAEAEWSGATGMFRAGMQAERRAQQAGVTPASEPSAGGRKVPQWLFLGHLFNDVILADEAARAASGSSVKTSLVKRVLLASAAAACLLYLGLLAMSYSYNSDLEDHARDAAKAIATDASGAALPSGAVPMEESLRRLETLRQALAQLADWNVNGAPLRYRWGLYRGDDMLPHLRRIYYGKFRQLLFGSTQDQMLAYLIGRPLKPAPGEDYGYPYDTLKAYLLTKSEWARSSDPALQEFLGSRLLARWSNGRDGAIGSARMDLARLQFDFYARDLHNGNPFTSAVDAATVDHSRGYLSGFSGVDRVYRSLLAEADKGHPPTSFNQAFPGTAQFVASNVPVAWAFTPPGWKFVQDRLKKQDFGGEAWVLGGVQTQAVAPAELEAGVRGRYAHDYIEQWRGVMQGSHVQPYANFQDAANKLTALTQPAAPLLHLLAWVSDNTNVDLPGVADRFRAVQTAVPPASQIYITPQLQGYNMSLINLQSAVAGNAGKGPGADSALQPFHDAAQIAAQGAASAFPPDPEAHLEARTLALLLEPITNLDNARPTLAGEAKRFCAVYTPLTNLFPFNPSAQNEVALEQLSDILRPKTGKLWTFYDATLKNALECQNGNCTPKGTPPLNRDFADFIGRLMKFSIALYGDSGTEPNMSYKLRPLKSENIPEFVVTVNGEAVRLKGDQWSRAFNWPGKTGTRGFQLALRFGGGDVPTLEFPGPWALFRFFAAADSQPGPNTFKFVFRTSQQNQTSGLNYSFDADTGGGPAVFSKDFLRTLKSCPPATR